MAKIPKPKKVKPQPKKGIANKPVDAPVTAKQFIAKLNTYQSDVELEKFQRYFKSNDDQSAGDRFMGVRMGYVFAIAKDFMEMSLAEIEKLLESPVHEVRAGAVSIMDFQARNKKTPASRRKELFKLYINRHARINNWDLVDLNIIQIVYCKIGYISFQCTYLLKSGINLAKNIQPAEDH